MRKAFALALIITVLAVVAYLTKPSDEACVTKANKEYEKTKVPSVNHSQNVNTELLAATLEKSFSERLSIEDNLLYKEIYLQQGTKTKIGWGAFGWVNVELK